LRAGNLYLAKEKVSVDDGRLLRSKSRWFDEAD
jgi:hypothetical protein